MTGSWGGRGTRGRSELWIQTIGGGCLMCQGTADEATDFETYQKTGASCPPRVRDIARRLLPNRETVGGWGLRAQARRHLHTDFDLSPLSSSAHPPLAPHGPLADLLSLARTIVAELATPSPRRSGPLGPYPRSKRRALRRRALRKGYLTISQRKTRRMRVRTRKAKVVQSPLAKAELAAMFARSVSL